MPHSSPSWIHARTTGVVAALLFLVTLTICAWRLSKFWPEYHQGTSDRWALASYRDATYYPIRAVIDGVNPYDSQKSNDPSRYMQRYPVADHFSLYSPLMLLLFAPFATLPPTASMIAFAIFNASLFIVLSYVALRWVRLPCTLATVFGLATLLLISQPGRSVFNSGQVAIPLALLSWSMLHFAASQPRLAIWATVLNTLKPTYGGPLGLLLLAAGRIRVSIIGLLIGGLIVVLGMGFVFARAGDLSAERIVAVLQGNNAHFQSDPEVVTSTNFARVDTAAALEYLTQQKFPAWLTLSFTVVILGTTAVILWRGRKLYPMNSAAGPASCLSMLAATLCIYHNIYDGLLFILPALAVCFSTDPGWQLFGRRSRRWLLVLLIIPFVNLLWTPVVADYFITQFAEHTDSIATMRRFAAAANGLSWTVAWVWIGVILMQSKSDAK
jgi:hypothetical protein